MQILKFNNHIDNKNYSRSGNQKKNNFSNAMTPLSKDTVSFSGVQAEAGRKLSNKVLLQLVNLSAEINKLKENLTSPMQSKKAIEKIVDKLSKSPVSKYEGKYAFILDKKRIPIFERMLDYKMSDINCKYIDYVESMDKSVDIKVKNDWALAKDDDLTPYFNLAIKKEDRIVAKRNLEFVKMRDEKIRARWLLESDKSANTPFDAAIKNDEPELAMQVVDMVAGLKISPAKKAWVLMQNNANRESFFNLAIRKNQPQIAHKILDIVETLDAKTKRDFVIMQNKRKDMSFAIALEFGQPDVAQRILNLVKEIDMDPRRMWALCEDVHYNNFDLALRYGQPKLAKEIFDMTLETSHYAASKYDIRDFENADDYLETATKFATSHMVRKDDALAFLEKYNHRGKLDGIITSVKDGTLKRKMLQNGAITAKEKLAAQRAAEAKIKQETPVVKSEDLNESRIAMLDEEYRKIEGKEGVYELFG